MTPEECEALYRQVAVGMPKFETMKHKITLTQQKHPHKIALLGGDSRALETVCEVTTETYEAETACATRTLMNIGPVTESNQVYVATFEYRTIAWGEEKFYQTLTGRVRFNDERIDERSVDEPWNDGCTYPEDRLIDLLTRCEK